MLTLVTGKTGSGKSYFVVKQILDIVSYSKIITNVKVDIEHPNYTYWEEKEMRDFLSLIGQDFHTVDNFKELVKKYKEHPLYGGATFFIDECHLLGFRKYDDALSNWLSVHRHFGQDIFLITQTTAKLHRNFLPEFQYWYRMIPSNKNITKDMMGYKKYDDVPTQSLIHTKYFKPDLELFEIYETGKNDSEANPAVKKFVLIILLLVSVVGALIYIIGSGILLPKYHDDNVSSYNENDVNITNNSKSIKKVRKLVDTEVRCKTSNAKPRDYVLLQKLENKSKKYYYCYLYRTYEYVSVAHNSSRMRNNVPQDENADEL